VFPRPRHRALPHYDEKRKNTRGIRLAIALSWIFNIILLVALLYLLHIVGPFYTSRPPTVCLHSPLPVRTDLTAPAQHVLEPQNVVFTDGFGNATSIYQGPSSPETDQAWEELDNCLSPRKLLHQSPEHLRLMVMNSRYISHLTLLRRSARQ
jgi:hypothetical protein